MEASGYRAQEQQEINVPDFRHIQCKQDCQDQGEQGNQAVCHDHHQAPVPAVHQGAGHRAEEYLGNQPDQGGSRQNGGRAGGLGQPPDQGKGDQLAAQQGKGLPAPDGEKAQAPSGRVFEGKYLCRLICTSERCVPMGE